MVKIANAPRPKDQREDYRFFKETKSGDKFKSLAETDIVGINPVLKVSVSQVDAEGKAMVDTDGNAIVSWHSHTFTPIELEDPDFDPEKRLTFVLTTIIEAYQTAKNNREKIDKLKAAWTGTKALDMTLLPIVDNVNSDNLVLPE